MSAHLLLPCLLLLSISGAESAASLLNGTVGGSVNFTVSVLNSSLLIDWNYKNNLAAQRLPNFGVRCYGQFIGRCEVALDGSLTLNRITQSDEGEYTMSATDPPDNIVNTASYELRVYDLLSSPVLKDNSSFNHFTNGTNVTLHCDAGNQTVTTYTFYRDEKTICLEPHVTCRESFLDFTPIFENDSGSYTCSIQNPVSTNASAPLNLTVLVPVSAVTLTSNASRLLIVGQDSVSLECSARGSAITFSWSLNGKPVSPNPPYYITQSNSPPHSNLTISPVSKNDTGPFTCTAANRAGNETSHALNFTVGWRPEEDINCSADSYNNSLHLGCSWLGGNPAANVTMIFDRVSTGGTSDQVVRNVSSSQGTQGSNLTCEGDQLGKTATCVLLFVPPMSNDNNSETTVEEGFATSLRVILTIPSRSRADSVSSQVLPADFSWFRSGDTNSIQNTSKFSVFSTGYESTLRISAVTAKESGIYECKATNFIGSRTFLFTVNVTSNAGNGPDNGLDVGKIIGIVIGVLAGVTLIGIILFFVLKKKKRSREDGRVNGAYEQTETIQYAEIKKGDKSNGGLAETVISNNVQDNKDDVKYAEIKFPNNPSTKITTPATPEETVYSDVKKSTSS